MLKIVICVLSEKGAECKGQDGAKECKIAVAEKGTRISRMT